MKLSELIDKRNTLRSKLEVYNELNIYLQEFISTDNRPAKKVIEYSGSQREFVPEYVIEDIISDLVLNFIEPLTKELIEIDQKDV